MAIICVAVPLGGTTAQGVYDYRERTRQLAFDPARFFTDGTMREPYISISYTGDDYDYPVYSIAIRNGCAQSDTVEDRKTSGARQTARMLRAPSFDRDVRPRARGQMLFGYLDDRGISSDIALRSALDGYAFEWVEADVGSCEPAKAYLATAPRLDFFPEPPLPDPSRRTAMVLHADKIDFSFGRTIERVRYHGWLGEGTPGAWANAFAKSLETCWRASSARKPWHGPSDR